MGAVSRSRGATSAPPSGAALATASRDLAERIRSRLLATRNKDDGWPYRAGNKSRIESTCWALLAMDGGVSSRVLRDWPRADHLLVDVPGAPVNYAFNALAALTMLADPVRAAEAEPIIHRLIDVKGKTYPVKSEIVRQNSELEGWSWIEGTACWVEPTAWCLLLLKKRREAGALADADRRIEIGNSLLFDRMCHDGGWNYGNANVYGKDLWPYVPTTALGLLALQDRAAEPAVRKSLAQLRSDLKTEQSVLALALSLICARLFREPTTDLEAQLLAQYHPAGSMAEEDLMATAVTAVALSEHAASRLALKDVQEPGRHA
jgi:hypothetical protein